MIDDRNDSKFYFARIVLLLKPSLFMIRDGLEHTKHKRLFSISVHNACHRTAEGQRLTRERIVVSSHKDGRQLGAEMHRGVLSLFIQSLVRLKGFHYLCN